MRPNDDLLPKGIKVTIYDDGMVHVSDEFLDLLTDNRSKYDWPAGTGAYKSQQIILALETQVADLMHKLTVDSAHKIITRVSEWAGNNSNAHRNILQASESDKLRMHDSLLAFDNDGGPCTAIDRLSSLPGISLVIASKVYRFCRYMIGGAVDRHASYFFNSLDVVLPDGSRRKALSFRREWANAGRKTSRLAIYSPSGYAWNRDQYVAVYLPLLVSISASLNAMGASYQCAVTEKQMQWRPTDVEMAAYYWWAGDGAR